MGRRRQKQQRDRRSTLRRGRNNQNPYVKGLEKTLRGRPHGSGQGRRTPRARQTQLNERCSTAARQSTELSIPSYEPNPTPDNFGRLPIRTTRIYAAPCSA